MTNYEQLMARLNKTTTVEATDNEQSFLDKAIDTVDRITSEAYGVTVDAIAAQYGAAKANVLATPALFEKGAERGQERAAAVLLKLLSK